MTDDVRRRIAVKQARLDRGDFNVPAHGIERYEHHGCRCDICNEAHLRVERLVQRLTDAMHDHPGRLPRGLEAPVDAAHSRELEALEPNDWRGTP